MTEHEGEKTLDWPHLASSPAPLCFPPSTLQNAVWLQQWINAALLLVLIAASHVIASENVLFTLRWLKFSHTFFFFFCFSHSSQFTQVPRGLEHHAQPCVLGLIRIFIWKIFHQFNNSKACLGLFGNEPHPSDVYRYPVVGWSTCNEH